jgi:hypothetical protein
MKPHPRFKVPAASITPAAQAPRGFWVKITKPIELAPILEPGDFAWLEEGGRPVCEDLVRVELVNGRTLWRRVSRVPRNSADYWTFYNGKYSRSVSYAAAQVRRVWRVSGLVRFRGPENPLITLPWANLKAGHGGGDAWGVCQPMHGAD